MECTIREVTHMVRRITAIVLLYPALDANYLAIKQARHPGQGYPRTVRACVVGVLQCHMSRRCAAQFRREHMAKKPEENRASRMKRRQRVQVSAKEALKRMQAFGKHREKFIAVLREGTD